MPNNKRYSVILNSNSSTVEINKYEFVYKAKITKFLLVPDNINNNVDMICVQIDGLNGNYAIANRVICNYFFMIPFFNNNNSPSYSNDLTDTWDFISNNGILLNKFVIRITDENGNLLTLNNSRIIIEIMFEC